MTAGVPGFPHAGVRLGPDRGRPVGRGDQQLLHGRRQVAEGVAQQVRGVEHLAEDIELVLLPGGIPHPDL